MNMASAPPLESDAFLGQPPPTYEESTRNPVWPQYGHFPGCPPPTQGKTTEHVYPVQGYAPAYSTQPPNPVNNANAIVSIQTIYMQPAVAFGTTPVHVHCNVCAKTILTRLQYSSGTLTWLTCVGLAFCGCIYGCCLTPFCLNPLKDVRHVCPSCNSILGTYRRI
ncbi:lipopolysaccharide-induced tumor necrosis factor-alpha factor homolog [Denticeps clupeoides]|uniref:LITAF domain-containing protein n=1 Tax=Denticeps clupeoides TaxID=299321 RepID=A0A8C4ARE9_9TELE|nr:lipopolysaccharide-induced tumor necrosis factor-alpha factor homolog [Denticeps clupeoides]XP_028842657.1 lipopolysaccharide-induced tumor necrosis factor-alpha factor homolog [Denticeps clupeoides]